MALISILGIPVFLRVPIQFWGNLIRLVCSLGLLAASVWGLCGGRLDPAAVFAVRAFAVVLIFPMVVMTAVFVLAAAGQAASLANKADQEKLSPTQASLPKLARNLSSPAMNPTIPPSNPPTNADLVAEAEQLEKGSLANEKLIQDTLFSAYTAASAKRNAVIPQETMVEPYLSKAPEGGRGRMTWEEIWVFQTQPKTAVRITFTEDGAGGADFAIHV